MDCLSAWIKHNYSSINIVLAIVSTYWQDKHSDVSGRSRIALNILNVNVKNILSHGKKVVNEKKTV